MQPQRDSPGPSYLPQMLRLAAVGTELLGWVVCPTLIGYWADARLGSEPWLVSIGGVLGIVGGLTMVIRRGLQINAEMKRYADESKHDE